MFGRKYKYEYEKLKKNKNLFNLKELILINLLLIIDKILHQLSSTIESTIERLIFF
jgi:hypothetical protein